MIFPLGVLALSLAIGAAAQPQYLLTEPSYQKLCAHPGVPPAFEDRLIYYNSFERPDAAPQINELESARLAKPTTTAGGIRGHRAAPENGQHLQLAGKQLSPHLPLTVAFWWALGTDGQVDSSFQLFHLTNGRGFISHFSRGRGKWCALQRPAGVLQVYYLPGIANVNGIYDRNLAAHLELKADTWHHTAIVFSGASLVEAYTDGKRVHTIRTRGRDFKPSDALHKLTIGGRYGLPTALDEVFVLRRALTDHQIATYVTSVRQMVQVAYPH